MFVRAELRREVHKFGTKKKKQAFIGRIPAILRREAASEERSFNHLKRSSQRGGGALETGQINTKTTKCLSPSPRAGRRKERKRRGTGAEMRKSNASWVRPRHHVPLVDGKKQPRGHRGATAEPWFLPNEFILKKHQKR